MPTLLALAGATPAALQHGRDLVPLLRAAPGFEERPVLTQTLHGNMAFQIKNLVTEGDLRVREQIGGQPGQPPQRYTRFERRGEDGAWSKIPKDHDDSAQARLLLWRDRLSEGSEVHSRPVQYTEEQKKQLREKGYW